MNLPLSIVTIVKNGMPWIACHWNELRKLSIPWRWHVVEGTAAPEACTSWCAPEPPGLSDDGTTSYLDSIAACDSRITLHRSAIWHGKIAMVNAAASCIFAPCVLMQIDSDELWTASQLEGVAKLFTSHRKATDAYFYCRYFLGPRIAITTRPGFGNHVEYEWLRAWRFSPGMRFKSHEPPVLHSDPVIIPHSATEKAGLVFDHMAYATESQVAFKAHYYGSANNKLGHLYASSLAGWNRLQANTKWPARVQDFLPFVTDESQCAPL